MTPRGRAGQKGTFMDEKHDQEFWENVLRLVEDDGMKLSFVITQYGISRSSYYYWKKRLRKDGGEAKADEAELERRRLIKENADLRMENEILKKAISIIGKR